MAEAMRRLKEQQGNRSRKKKRKEKKKKKKRRRRKRRRRRIYCILDFKLCRVLYVVCFLLGNYPASGVYMPTFRNTLSVPSS